MVEQELAVFMVMAVVIACMIYWVIGEIAWTIVNAIRRLEYERAGLDYIKPQNDIFF